MFDYHEGPVQESKGVWTFDPRFSVGSDADEARQRLRNLAAHHTVFMGWVIGFNDLTTGIHAAMAAFMQGPSLYKLGLVPRDFFKTSLWTIADSVRIISTQPEERILIRNEIHDN